MNDPSSPAGYDSDDDKEPPTLVQVESVRASRKERSAVATDDTTPPPACPVTILSGFLGSGKTTLIQYILRSPDHGKRIAVIENEYGEGLQVESMIARDGVNDSSLTDLIELPNGCICCTVKDSLVATLENLLEKRQDLDYILIECSGMANPGPIASLFWLDDALESRLRLDGIVTLVDGKNIQEQLVTTEEAAQQIAYADRILLNKTDLLLSSSGSTTITVESLIEKLQRINPTAPIRPTQYSAVPDLDWVLEARCFDPDRLVEYHENSLTEPSAEHEHHHHDHDNHDCSACKHLAEHKHTNAVQTISIVEPGSVDLDRVDRWLALILWPNQDEDNKVLKTVIDSAVPEGKESSHNASTRLSSSTTQIFRIKGVLDAGPEDSRRHIVQAVHDLWEIHPGSDSLRWKPEEERKCKLVLIGRNLCGAELREGFRACRSS